MTKTKRQLRAEAVERLRECGRRQIEKGHMNTLDLLIAEIGDDKWGSYRENCDALIDLLIDEPTNGDGDGIPLVTDEIPLDAPESHGDALRSVSGANADTDKGEDAKTPETARECVDSREKLEADALALVDNLRAYGFKYAGDAEVEIIDMLDRQAAITERHWMEICGANANANVELNRQNDELRLKVRRQGKQLAEVQDAIRKRNEGVLKDSWKKQLAELEAERDMYRENMLAQARMVGEVTAERDMYRDRLGEAVDAAQQIAKLMEVKR